MAITKEQAIDILEKFDFFQGQRAGRELWNDKPFEVQEQDIKAFSKDVAELKAYINDVVPKSEVEKWIGRCREWYSVAELKSNCIMELDEGLAKANSEIKRLHGILLQFTDVVHKWGARNDIDTSEISLVPILQKEADGIVGKMEQEIETLKDNNEHLAVILEETKVELEAMRTAANSYKMHYERLATEIFDKIERAVYAFGTIPHNNGIISLDTIAELKKKYTEEKKHEN